VIEGHFLSAEPLPPVALAAPAPGRQTLQLRCRNCQFVLGEPRPAFCAACGQDSSPKAPTVGEFIQHLGGNYMAMEGALWRTLGLLLFRPGQLTREYLAGRKRRYVLPVRLYLTISLIALLALRMTNALEIPDGAFEGRTGKLNGGKSFIIVDGGTLRAGVDEAGAFYCEGLPDWMCRKLSYRFDMDPKNLKREFSEAQARFLSHWSTSMFLLLPMFAVWLKLVFLNRRMRYTEHLVFALHLHAFWFAMLLCAVAGAGGLRAAALLAVPVYAQLAMRRVYGGRWWTDLLRSGLLIVLYGATLTTALVLVLLWTMLS
jgi:hypothetical protein